jgi:hypothetical protein
VRAATDRDTLLKPVLLWNGIIDLGCGLVLMILPRFPGPILGYGVFDAQGTFMAGGWAMAVLAMGLTRIWTSTKPKFHDAMLLLGLLEGFAVAGFCVISLALGLVSIPQAALPLAVGAVFGVLYLVSALIWNHFPVHFAPR